MKTRRYLLNQKDNKYGILHVITITHFQEINPINIVPKKGLQTLQVALMFSKV